MDAPAPNPAPRGDTSAGESEQRTFAIGELCREFDVTLRALRFYENKGLISADRHGAGPNFEGTRVYSAAERERLALILKYKKLGFSLRQIKELLEAQEGDADALKLSREKCLEQIELLQRQKAEIEEGLTELDRIYRSLTGSAPPKA